MIRLLQLSFTWVAMAGLIAAPIPVQAQTTTETPAPAEPQTLKLSAEELDKMLAPIALYPDPLLAQILPASTEPGDIVMAARYVAAGKDVSKIDAQPWEESVKALAHYPDVLKMMDSKLDWTTHLGEAFVAQPEDVFNSVQRLRAKAKEAGNLKETSQQTVVVEKEVIKIMPADPQVIYVPQYPPETVYVQQPADVVTPLITFGLGLAMGAWIHNEVDWHNHGVYYHNSGWHGGYYGGGNYHGGGNNINIDNSNNINIGNGSGNNVGNGNRPGNGNGGSAWKPQQRPSQLPSYGNTGNRPGNGNTPGKPSQLPANGNNRQSTAGDRGNGQRQQKPAANRPSTLPTQAGSRQNGQNQFQREGTKPRQSTRPQPSQGNRAAGGAGGRANGGGGGGGGLGRR